MSLQFWRTKQFSDKSFLDLITRTFGVSFTGTTEARTWLSNNGYFTSYPDIVNDGLVLNLDTQNLSSFRGEPTTNIATNTFSQNGWAGIFTLINSDTKTFDLKQTYTSSASAWRTWYYSVSSYIGQSVTISAYYEVVAESNGVLTQFNVGQGNTGTYPYHIQGSDPADRTSVNTKEYQYLTWSGVINATGIVGFCFWCGSLTSGGYVTCRVHNVQVEVKDYDTPFVNGTRGLTPETGGGWLDLSGNDNNLDLSNITFNSTGMIYNGGQYIDTGFGASRNMTTQPISFCCWVKSDDTTASRMFLSAGQYRGTSDANARFYFGTNSGHWTFGIRASGWSSTGPVVTGDWTHIACSMTGTYARFFVNGVYDTQKSYLSYNLNDSINIGRHDSSYYWVGSIDTLLIYNKTLLDDEVLQNFNSQKIRFGL